ncbi:hypothetical protein GCM10027059_35350 [Myceligenerans halotolerans]
MSKRLRVTVAAGAVAACLAMTAAATAGAAPAAEVQAVRAADTQAALDMANFELRPNSNGDLLQERVNRLDAELPNVGVGAVIAEANRTGRLEPGIACNSKASDEVQRVAQSFCFNGPDNATEKWYPQGVTTIADAQDDKFWGETNQPILVSWYDKEKNGTPEKGVRVTFIDGTTGKYRHVLLVYPRRDTSFGNPTYESVKTEQTADGTSLHAGGIVWYGNFLYVADTGRGFRVFDMRHIYDLKAADNGSVEDSDRVGRHSNVYYGHGYRYVMPQVASWTGTAPKDDTRCPANPDRMRFSYVGLDRSGLDHIVAGEYCKSSDAHDGRVAAWPIAESITADGKHQITDTGYRWQADAAHQLPHPHIQGAVRFDSRWYLSRSRGDDESGTLYQTTPTSTGATTLTVDKEQHTGVGPEDLSHWEVGTGGTQRGTIWTVTEHPDMRMVYAAYPPEIDG